MLGRGTSATVYMVTRKSDEKVFACKKIKLENGIISDDLKNEMKISSNEFESPFLVRMWGSFQDKDYLYIILDLCKRKDLKKFLTHWEEKNRAPLPEEVY